MMRRSRLLLLGATGLAVLGGAVVAWLGVTGRHAQQELTAAKAELGPLRSEVLSGDSTVPARIAALQKHASAAEDATHDPVWSLAASIPWLGSPLRTTQGLTAAVDTIAAHSLPVLANAATDVHPARLLDSGALDVNGLARAAKPLQAADASLHAQRDAVAKLGSSWLGPVSAARTQLLDQLTELSGLTTSVTQAAEIAPGLLGKDGTRRYFVGFQNPAESRGTGGLIDAFAIVRAENGKLVVEKTGANTQLPALPDAIPGLSQTFLDRYAAQGASTLWLNANLSPDFSEVGPAWVAMWKAATGEQLDGALALDPAALAAVLQASGPVTAPVVGTVGADKIEKLILLEQYQRADLADRRKQLMLDVGVQTMNAVLGGKAKPQTLVPKLAAATAKGHVMLYSRVASEEKVLLSTNLSGAVSQTDGPFAEAVVVNSAGNKLDSWLSQSLSYQVQHCSPSGRDVAVTVSLTNSAPTTGLPTYVTVRSDKPDYATVVGQNRVELQLLVTKGSQLVSATLDGTPVPVAPPADELPSTLPTGGLASPAQDSAFVNETTTAGRPSYGMEMEIKPGARRTLVVNFKEPNGVSGAPLLPLQVMVNQPTATADVTACDNSS